MATHDYVISNASGAAVRADLNNALAAIVSNNSNATEPSTTYAYQWWADTGSLPAVMKLRNAANDAWIVLFQLDGETGVSIPSTDVVAISTGGTEALRLDSSGRLLVGTSSSANAGLGQYAFAQVQSNSSNSSGQAILSLRRGSVPGSGSALGEIAFSDNTGNEYAVISAFGDGVSSSGDYPGRLVFSTTADGASSPTERMRLTSLGVTNCFNSTADVFVARSSNSAGITNFVIRCTQSATGTTDGTVSFQVATNGNVTNTNGSYTSISDVKLKENIVDATSQWADLKSIKIRNWNFKEETGHETHRQIGPIAQELEEVCPGLVFETPDPGADGLGTGEFTKGINQSVLYMKAVKALQEAMERIETLEARVAALEAA